MTDKFRKIRPGAYFYERILGLRELNAGLNFTQHISHLWLEIPMSQIGQGRDFDFRVLDHLKKHVVINRFEGLAQELNQKDRFAANAALYGGKDLVVPATIACPVQDESVLDDQIAPGELWLSKPTFGGAGKGIELFHGPQEARKYAQLKDHILQRYISNPLTVNGHRFSMRVYGVIASIEPLEVYLNDKEGIIKFTTEVFDANNVTLNGSVIRQEQYRKGTGHGAINISGTCFKGHCQGSRWDLDGFWSHFRGRKAAVWWQIKKCAAAAIRAAVASGNVKHRDKAFQVLGIDFDFDEDFLAYFIEANVTPALGFQTEWEQFQKERVLFSLPSLLKLPATSPAVISAQSWEQII